MKNKYFMFGLTFILYGSLFGCWDESFREMEKRAILKRGVEKAGLFMARPYKQMDGTRVKQHLSQNITQTQTATKIDHFDIKKSYKEEAE